MNGATVIADRRRRHHTTITKVAVTTKSQDITVHVTARADQSARVAARVHEKATTVLVDKTFTEETK